MLLGVFVAAKWLDCSSCVWSLVCTQQVKALATNGFNVVVTGGKVGELALHFLNKYKIMVVR